MNKKHERTKFILKIIGPIVIAAGLACTATGFADMIISTNEGDMPQLFWLMIIGLPALGIGGMITAAAFRRELTTYIKNETVPVINETGEEIAPAVSAIAGAARANNEDACPFCGQPNDDGAEFCRHCGKPLYVTCPACGRNVRAGAFCDKCGAKLNSEQ